MRGIPQKSAVFGISFYGYTLVKLALDDVEKLFGRK